MPNGNGDVRTILEQPFPAELIRTRPGSFGNELSYVEAVHYIHKLNQAYNGEWSFEIVTHEVGEKEVIVVGKLIAGGIIKMAFGSSDITRKRDSGEIMCIGDDLKAASTDALKKAASLLGLGLSLYGDAQQAGGTRTETGKGNGNGQSKGNGNGHGSRLTSRQLSAILAIGRERNLDKGAINDMSLARFGKNVEFISKADASSLIGELQGV